MSERHIQAEILLALGARSHLGRFWRQNVGKARPLNSPHQVITYGVPGAADISGILADGRRAELEVKRPGEYQSPEQKRFQAMIESLGGFYAVVRSVDEAVAAVEAALAGKAVR